MAARCGRRPSARAVRAHRAALGALHAQTEASFQAQVIELARLRRWRHYHTRDSRRSVAGFPDLVLVRRERLIVAELKAEGGRLTREQAGWIGDLEVTPAEVHVWRPSDWPEIEVALR